jgi:hypothetical protein
MMMKVTAAMGLLASARAGMPHTYPLPQVLCAVAAGHGLVRPRWEGT